MNTIFCTPIKLCFKHNCFYSKMRLINVIVLIKKKECIRKYGGTVNSLNFGDNNKRGGGGVSGL